MSVEFLRSSHPGPLIGLFIEQAGSEHRLSHVLLDAITTIYILFAFRSLYPVHFLSFFSCNAASDLTGGLAIRLK
jgi:hypothetical protein